MLELQHCVDGTLAHLPWAENITWSAAARMAIHPDASVEHVRRRMVEECLPTRPPTL